MVELKIAKARQEVRTAYVEVQKAITDFENNPTKANRLIVNQKIQILRKNLTAFKAYINGLYLKF